MLPAYLLGGTATSTPVISWPPAQPRAPLPPFPSFTAEQPGPPQAGCWAKTAYDTALPFTPPSKPVLEFHRGNFQLQVPGFTEGFNDKDRSLVMTWEGPAFSERAQGQFLDHYAFVCGYTHIVVSIPQTKNLGKSLDDLVAFAYRAELRGLFIIVNVMGGDGESFADVQPWLDALVGIQAAQILNVAWQIDDTRKLTHDGETYTSALVDVTLPVVDYAQRHGLKVAQHWMNEACALWPYPQYGIADRFDYGRFMLGKVHFQYFQCNVDAEFDQVQSALAEAAEGHPRETWIVPTEYETQAIADDPAQRLELYGDCKGYLATCAHRGDKVMGGYLGGARLPNGHVL